MTLRRGKPGWKPSAMATTLLRSHPICSRAPAIPTRCRQSPALGVYSNYAARRKLGQKAQLEQRIGQLGDEIHGLEAQQSAKAQEVVLIRRELGGVRDLYTKNLVPLTRLTQLEREATRMDGERAQLVASVAQAQGKIAETRLQIIQVDRDLGSEVAKDLSDIEAKMGEFVERKVTAEDQLKRTVIRAPQTGTVFQSTVHTIGGVITAGDPIMLIVPNSDNLQVEAKVNPQDIDQVKIGQSVVLRFSAFNIRTTPEINGEVTCFILAVLVSPFKSKNRLEAENAACDFEGFVLGCCEGERAFRSRERGVETVILRAPRERKLLEVFVHEKTKKIERLILRP